MDCKQAEVNTEMRGHLALFRWMQYGEEYNNVRRGTYAFEQQKKGKKKLFIFSTDSSNLTVKECN